jgi:hypothetical protein
MVECPQCKGTDSRVIAFVGTKRRRVCQRCETRWTTQETIEPGSIWRKGDDIPAGVSSPAPARPMYSPDFERLWAGCSGKKGNKFPAFKAFNRIKPKGQDLGQFVTTAIRKWEAWMGTDSWKRGYSKHLSSWLAARGFDDDPDPSQFKAPGAPVGHARAEVKSRPDGEVKL